MWFLLALTLFQNLVGQSLVEPRHQQITNFPQDEASMPPHCSRAIVTASQSSRLTKRSARQKVIFADATPIGSQVSINIGVDHSVCFRLSEEEQDRKDDEDDLLLNSNAAATTIVTPNGVENKLGEKKESSPDYLYILTLTDVEQQHSITERYTFAIPELESKCICECESSSANCLADEYKYGRCPQSATLGNGEQQKSVPNRSSTILSACYRTFHPNQPMTSGCSNAAGARLCCDLRFRAYEGRSFTAIRLERPISYATLSFMVFSWNANLPSIGNKTGDGWWKEVEHRRILVQLDGSIHNVVLNERVGLKLSIIGLEGAKSGTNQLSAGMYYVENFENGEYGEIRGGDEVNRINENNAEKLGWFRFNNGVPLVQFGEIFLDAYFKAKSENCLEQRYHSVLNSRYYISIDRNDSSTFALQEPLNKANSWIRSAKISDSLTRLAVVKVIEGMTLEATLAVNSPSNSDLTMNENSHRSPHQPQTQTGFISFVHNSSRMDGFDAFIVVDSSSRSMLNITVYNASGVLNGYIREKTTAESASSDGNNKDSVEIESFTIHVPSLPRDEKRRLGFAAIRPTRYRQHSDEPTQRATTAKTVLKRIRSYPVHKVHEVCLRPDDAGPDQEICSPVVSIHYELAQSTMINEWTTNKGSCPNCNQINVDGFKWFLNPANWTKGVSSVSEALMLVSDVFGYLFILMVLYVVIMKVFVPLINCCCFLSPTRLFFSGRKS